MAYGYSSDSAQQELSNEYQHDRIEMKFNLLLLFCALDKSINSVSEELNNCFKRDL